MVASLSLIRSIVGLWVWTAILLPPLAWGQSPSVEAAPPAKGTFEAQWSVEGTQEKLDFAGLNSFAIFQHTGTVTVLRKNGFVANALSKCIGLRDDQEGIVSRCVWISANGDQIFSELKRISDQPRGRVGRGEGQIVGGTGRYQGISGSYELHWVDEWERSPNAIKGKTLSMQGQWSLPMAPAKAGGS